MRLDKGILVILQNGPIEDDLRVQREVTTLRNAGYRISLICPEVEYGEQSFEAENVYIFRYPPPAPGDCLKSYIGEYLHSWAHTAKLSVKAYRDVGFDAIHACNPPDIFFPIGILYKFIGKKFVFDQHDLSPEIYLSRFSEANRKLYKVLRMLEYLTYKTADAVLVTNNSYKNIAVSRGGVSEGRVYIVRNGPYLRFTNGTSPNPELKRGHKYLVCCMGQLAPQDGADYVLKLADYLVNKKGRDDICFTLVGDGSSLNSLKQMAAEMGISDHVFFTGWIRDWELLRSYLLTADICISPEPKSSYNEHSTFIKVLDYMSAGKPIVAFDLPETRASADRAALYATPNSEVEMAEKVEMLLVEDDLRRKMGLFGKERIENSLLWEHSETNLVKAYSDLFSGRRL